MKLYKRLLSLLLVCFVCFGLFSVNAYAVEEVENLVDGNMSNWVDFGDESPYFQSADVTFLGNSVNYIEIPSNSTTVLLFDLTQFLKIGDSYRFAFNLPTTNGYNISSLTSCVLTWALCDGSGDDFPTVGNNVFEINIDDTNKSKYLGKTTVFEFTYTQGFQNTFLCLAINPGENLEVYNDLELYISNISLERVTSENEKKLDGILGWLQDIWNSLSDLGDKISGFFTDLIDNLRTFFEELPRKIFNYEIEVTDDDIISGGNGSEEEEKPSGFYYEYDFSTLNLSSYSSGISNSLYAELLNDNVLYFRGPLSSFRYKTFSDFPNIPGSNFETLKTYVFEFTISNFSFTSSDYGHENDFEIFLPNGESVVIPINNNGVYKTSFTLSSRSENFSPTYLTIARNYSYCISDMKVYEVVEGGSTGDTGSDNEGTTTKVSWFQYLINKFKSWFNSIIDSVKGFFDDLKLKIDVKIEEIKQDLHDLFIPNEGYFDDLSNRFDLLIEERFGALVTITDYLVEFFSSFNADTTKEFFDVPIININLMGYNFPIGGWKVRFVPQFNGVEILTNACKFISSVLATFAFFDGLKNKYHEVFGGGE